jgi:hypothetical protein
MYFKGRVEHNLPDVGALARDALPKPAAARRTRSR